MEALLRWREPAAFVLLGALAVRILLGLIGVVFYADQDRYASFAVAALIQGSRTADGLMIVALAGLVACCMVVRPTRHARLLTLLATLACGLAVAVSLVFGLIGLLSGSAGSVLTVLELLATLTVSAVSTAALALLLLRPQPVPVGAAQPAHQIPAGEPPVWQPDQAAGAAWHSAGAAAAGAPAAGWGSDSDAAGWQPIPQQPPDPPRRDWDGTPQA